MVNSDGVEHGTGVCPSADRSSPNGDLSWLLSRAAHRIKTALDDKARDYGLAGFRDWIVLAALNSGVKRTQLALGHEVALDKTTLMAVLDRLERDGFVLRTVDPLDRRVRVPESTVKGREVHEKLRGCRDGVENELLSAISDEERWVFQSVLTRLATDGCEAKTHGSCM